jgi:hypothetical protein
MDDKNLSKLIGNLDFTNLSKLDVKVPDFNFNFPQIEPPSINKKILDEMSRSNREKYEREVENNEYLKALVAHNEDISNYNRELVELNRKILNKINSLDDTLLFLNEAFVNKTEIDKEQGQSHNALLLELITIMDSKDGEKLKQFTNTLAAPVIAGLIVEYLKLKLGLSK